MPEGVGAVLVNATGVSFHDTAVHSCPELTIQSGENSTSVCTEEGIWSPVDITCTGKERVVFSLFLTYKYSFLTVSRSKIFQYILFQPSLVGNSLLVVICLSTSLGVK